MHFREKAVDRQLISDLAMISLNEPQEEAQ